MSNNKLKNNSVEVYIPTEFFSALDIIIKKGLEKIKIPRKDASELKMWWDVESEIIKEKIKQMRTY